MPTWKKVVVSGSAISQLNNDANYLQSTGAGIVSSSAQTIENIVAAGSGIVSSSGNIAALGAGIISSSAQIDTDLFDIDNLVSSSAQLASDISGSFVSASDALGTRIDNITSTFDIAGDSGTDTVTTGETLTFVGDDGKISTAVTDNTVTFTLNDDIVSSSAQLAADISGAADVRIEALNTETGSIASEQAVQDARLNALDVETGSIASEQAVQDARLDKLDIETGSIATEQAVQDARLDALDVETGSIATEQATQDARLNTIEAATSSYVTALGGGIISGAAEGSAQGTIALNGVDVDVNGMQTGDSPTFTNLTLSGNLTVSGTTTTVDSTTLDIGDNIISLNGVGSNLGGIAVNDGPASGSLLWDGTNDRWIAGATGSESAVLTALGYGVVSASAQIALSGLSDYDANDHIDHTTVDITAGDGLTGGGDISATRTLAVGAGDGITVNADDIAVDATVLRTTGDGVLSGSAQIAVDISGSFVSASDALGTRIDNITSTFDIAGDSGTDTVTTGQTLTFTGDDGKITTAVTDNTVTLTLNDDIVSSSAQLAADISGAADIRIEALNTETGSIATEQAVQDARLNALDIETGSIASEQAVQDARLNALDIETGSIATEQATQDARLDKLDIETGSIATEQATQDARLDALDVETGSIATEQATQDARLNTIEAATSSYVTALGGGIISGAAEGSAQGTIALNGVDVDVNGMQTGDSPTFTNLTLSGNLTVSGTTTTIDTNTLDIGDNIIALNGVGSNLGGIAVNDGPASGSLLWDGTNDRWIAGATGSESAVLTALGYGVISQSAQVSLTGLSDYDANDHIDHTTVDITAGDGLTGGGDISATRTLAVGAGDGISVAADAVAVDATVLRTTGNGVLSGSAQIATDISGSFVSASDALGVRIDNITSTFDIAGDSGTDTVTTGQTLTFSGDNSITTTVTDNTVTFTLGDGVISSSQGIVDLGADIVSSSAQIADDISGSLSATAVANLGASIVSASTLASASQGTLTHTVNGVATTIPLGVNASDSPTFANLTLTGNLTVTGDTVEQQVTNLAVEDQFITINSGAAAQDAGFFFEGQGASFGWDESENRFALDFTGGTANQTTITSDAYVAAVAVSDSDANYQKDGNIFVSASGDAFIYVS